MWEEEGMFVGLVDFGGMRDEKYDGFAKERILELRHYKNYVVWRHNIVT